MQSSSINPFATRYTRPGAMAFTFPQGASSAELLAQLEAQGWWGQIVGPHGTGKSTLLHTLAREFPGRDREVAWFTQSMHERRLNVAPDEVASWNARTQVIIDGYEQLGWLSRRWIKSACRRAQAGLLVTTHADVGLPTLWKTTPDEQLAWSLVQTLQQAGNSLIGREDVSRCYQEHAGNLRETLFALYDLYERRSRGAS